MTDVILTGTGLYTPPSAITNDELVTCFNIWVRAENKRNHAAIEAGENQPLPESCSAFIEKASGIRSRYVMDKEGILDPERMLPRIPERNNDEPSVQCEMAVTAAKDAFGQARLSADDIDGVIVACSNMQRPYPAVAVEVQHFLGTSGFAFDMNVACSSATFGLQVASDMIRSGSARRILMVNPEICTGHLNFRDRDSHFIFGDACTAVVLESADVARTEGWKVRGTRLWTSFSNNIRNNAGFLNRAAEEGLGARDKLFVQNGRKVFKEVCPQVAKQITEHLGDSGIPVSDVSRLWLHQANLAMNQLISKKVFGREARPEEAPVILDEYANTSSAGSVIAFHKHSQGMKAGSKGVLCSFGAGYSIGSVILEKR
ncbi:beta-ketoacyl-ACP synthase III [Sansalvadorimonas verongulae]|uniref:beta-ketoacyl-ACP synthase III n=1 Tax=Sansalvadorimonas verongulae TaxID=2172824 RepID=UPI002E354BB0|nr:beta-ketoacyl-ACP synthase III [Sansalvadorimonas verongulae]MTI12588.1 beta-ketoacyl-ACP synthase III [Sansalvadorimonas verongulae]